MEVKKYSQENKDLINEAAADRTQEAVDKGTPELFDIVTAIELGITDRNIASWMNQNFHIRKGWRGFFNEKVEKKNRKRLLKYKQNVHVVSGPHWNIRYTNANKIQDSNILAYRFNLKDNFEEPEPIVVPAGGVAPTPTPPVAPGVIDTLSDAAKNVIQDGRTIEDKINGLKAVIKYKNNQDNQDSATPEKKEIYTMFIIEKPYADPFEQADKVEAAKEMIKAGETPLFEVPDITNIPDFEADYRNLTVLMVGPNTEVAEFDVNYHREFGVQKLSGAGEKLFGYEVIPKKPSRTRRLGGWIKSKVKRDKRSTICGKLRARTEDRKFFKVKPVENKYTT